MYEDNLKYVNDLKYEGNLKWEEWIPPNFASVKKRELPFVKHNMEYSRF